MLRFCGLFGAIALVVLAETQIELPSPPTMVFEEDDLTSMELEDQTPVPTLFAKQSTRMCVDHTLTSFFRNKTPQTGPIPSGFLNRPATLTACELEQLHIDCANRLNMYRSGALKFSDGTSDTNVLAGLRPLVHRTGSNRCSSGAALGDLITNVARGGGCNGAHENAFVCQPSGSRSAQNACCGRGGGSFGSRQVIATYSTIQRELYACLQQMWDEGINPGQKGHWETMRSKDLTHVSCGFAFTDKGRVMMNQDFFARDATCTPVCTACNVPDSCGGRNCVCSNAAAAAVVPANAQDNNANNNKSGSSNTVVAVSVVVAVVALLVAGVAVWKWRARTAVSPSAVRSAGAHDFVRAPTQQPYVKVDVPQSQGSVAAMRQKFES